MGVRQGKKLLAVAATLSLLSISACGGDDDGGSTEASTTSTAEIASPQELTQAEGEIAGTCLAAKSLGAPLNAGDIADLREQLRVLSETAAADPEAPTSDTNHTVRDALFDLVGQTKGCDPGLEAELQHAIDQLP